MSLLYLLTVLCPVCPCLEMFHPRARSVAKRLSAMLRCDIFGALESTSLFVPLPAAFWTFGRRDGPRLPAAQPTETAAAAALTGAPKFPAGDDDTATAKLDSESSCTSAPEAVCRSRRVNHAVLSCAVLWCPATRCDATELQLPKKNPSPGSRCTRTNVQASPQAAGRGGTESDAPASTRDETGRRLRLAQTRDAKGGYSEGANCKVRYPWPSASTFCPLTSSLFGRRTAK